MCRSLDPASVAKLTERAAVDLAAGGMPPNLAGRALWALMHLRGSVPRDVLTTTAELFTTGWAGFPAVHRSIAAAMTALLCKLSM